jgi:hypothetical protein
MLVACGSRRTAAVSEKLCLHVDAAAVAIAIRIGWLCHRGCGRFADQGLIAVCGECRFAAAGDTLVTDMM